MKHRPASESPLIFDWRRHDVSSLWLGGFVMITLLGLASLFILFRIVTPETPTFVARPQQMILLNPEVPAERALIHRAMDRSFALLPSESMAASEVPSVLLPAFRPGNLGFQATLRAEDPTTPSQVSVPLGVVRVEDVLPPLPRAALPTPAGSRSVARLLMQVSGRPVLRSGDLAGIALLDPERVRFRVGLDAMGRPQLVLALGSSEDPQVTARLHAALLSSRFQPLEKGDAELEWVEVTFGWQVEKANAP
jgi:hypothetical protein